MLKTYPVVCLKASHAFSQHDEHYGLAHIGERELAEYEEHIREKNQNQ